jgi:hypothetical protein
VHYKGPIEILNQIDKYRKHCLWRGGEIESKKPCLAAWDLVTRPKMKGSLGIIRLTLQNNALLMKNLHKFFNKADLPWVKLIWSKYYPNDKVQVQQRRVDFGGQVSLVFSPPTKE